MLSRFLVHGVRSRDIAKIMHIVFAHVEFQCVLFFVCFSLSVCVLSIECVFSTSRTNERAATMMQPFSCISRCEMLSMRARCRWFFFCSSVCCLCVSCSYCVYWLEAKVLANANRKKANTILIYHALLRASTKCRTRTYFSLHWNCSRFCRKWTTYSLQKSV